MDSGSEVLNAYELYFGGSILEEVKKCKGKREKGQWREMGRASHLEAAGDEALRAGSAQNGATRTWPPWWLSQ